MKNVYDLPKEKCTGCGACKNICPTGAIDLKYDIDGFLYPIINQEKCINCGKCYKFCPAENYNFTNKEQTECYAVMAKDDVRLKSSSGGVFGFLANYVLDNNGIVCGTKYTNNYDAVEHILISDKKEVESLYKAKYVQSDTKDCFKRIKEYLEENKLVLFCGCPCQVAGLKMFLKNEYANLITCDILCHGVGSNLAYKKYLQDISNGKAITKVDFRPKEKNGWGNYTQINFDDGTEYYKNWTKDSWYLGFLKGITVRKSCGSCKYARRTRVGDFTIGDFWGIDRQNKDFNDNNGTSLVIVNNKKAIEILNSIKKDLKLCEKANLQMASENNNVLNRPDGLHPYRTEFFEKLHRLSYTQAFSYIYNKYDVGIIGFWNGNNYGSSFTYFALAKTIQSLGYRVCFIEEPYCLVNNVNRSTVPYK
ncbi:MAG: Coenzyme F420 hydrogenase/dehydrogenase, beta subunit C-terminal domain, partial [Christensenellales bacterium]